MFSASAAQLCGWYELCRLLLMPSGTRSLELVEPSTGSSCESVSSVVVQLIVLTVVAAAAAPAMAWLRREAKIVSGKVNVYRTSM